MICKIKKLFSDRFNKDNSISELNSKIKDLEAENKKLKFALEEKELEHKDDMLELENKIEKLTEENSILSSESFACNFKLNKIISICSNFSADTNI